jgi:hypothetical protein
MTYVILSDSQGLQSHEAPLRPIPFAIFPSNFIQSNSVCLAHRCHHVLSRGAQDEICDLLSGYNTFDVKYYTLTV